VRFGSVRSAGAGLRSWLSSEQVVRRTVAVMSQYMAWPTEDGVWHIGTGLTLPPGAGLADLNELLTRRHIERAQIGFHRRNDEAKFNEQFAIDAD
jgi:hypothetical protein